jgi:hypothetical protein
MPDGHHGVIFRDDGVRVEIPFEPPEELAPEFPHHASPRALVEADDKAPAMVVRFPPIVQQEVQRGGRNAALLHSCTGMLGEGRVHVEASDRSCAGGNSWTQDRGGEAQGMSHPNEKGPVARAFFDRAD